MNPHCRIGKIRFKNGAVLQLLPDRRAQEHEWLAADLREAVESCIEPHHGEMCGYAVVVWDTANDWSAAVRCGEFSRIRDTQVPTYVSEMLRRRLWRRDARHEVQSIVSGNDDEWQ